MKGLLVINAGSSSVRFALYALEGGALSPCLKAHAEGLGSAPRLHLQDGVERTSLDLPPQADQQAAVEAVLDRLEQRFPALELLAAGHRVVHGGPRMHRPLLLDQARLRALENFSRLAPLHNPHNLNAIHALAERRPDLPQVACFDTAFHRSQPRLAQLFGLPREYAERGILRYGFHGLSYEYIASVLPEYAPEASRVVVAHLGNGASMCAIHDGESVASSMGFTALDGLMMGRRCGSLDPGVVLHLIEQEGMSAAEVSDLLYQRSGLLGVSGVGSDMRELLASDAPEAREAVELFCYRARRELGDLVAAMGGLDALVFTAGIGENSAEIRAGIAGSLGWLGLELDRVANDRGEMRISAAGSRVSCWTLATDEEGMIARHTLALVEPVGR
ncbi:acetate/propionate family kinase [Alkalilimnicola sp. S0819]|uniref:acetate/propionate family kinase n=1 Tax=Alkalilimnicola sp. S0819 TaxID=2613922 RepID=UPI0012620512|nr:acetate/propionate family kinase [Alkalilimnicola sp. S0819]KAB7622982.1 acetate/propionate family kinase [Alkalilimnicola sp. S0819]MPQ17091.1 acetate/propionate family kinase [Alkalilimnicola sp. S0819]